MASLTKLNERVEAAKSLNQSKNNIDNSLRNLKSMMETVRTLKEKMETDTTGTYTVEDVNEAKVIYNATLDSLQNELNTYSKL